MTLQGEQSIQAPSMSSQQIQPGDPGLGFVEATRSRPTVSGPRCSPTTRHLGPTQKGMDFPMTQNTDIVGKVDLQKVVVDRVRRHTDGLKRPPRPPRWHSTSCCRSSHCGSGTATRRP